MISKVKIKLIYTCIFEVHNFKTRITQNHKIACFVSRCLEYLKKYLWELLNFGNVHFQNLVSAITYHLRIKLMI